MLSRWLAVPLLFGALLTPEAEARQVTDGAERATFGIYGGAFAPASGLGLGPGSEFVSNGTIGVTATAWANRFIGIRGNVLYSSTDFRGPGDAFLASEDPDVWLYNADLVLRLPLGAGRALWAPYILGGLGAKTYDFERARSRTEFAGNLGAGIEYRLGRWGIQLEARDFISSFNLGDAVRGRTQHDLVYTGGITFTL